MNRVKQITVGASRGRDVAQAVGAARQQRLELRSTRFSNCITSFDKDNLLLIEYE